jgi:hypothetical protein
MQTSYAWELNLVEWQLFLHLSFRALMPSFDKRLAKCKRLIRQIAHTHSLQPTLLPVVIRFENGERTGRPHCHAVLAGLPTKGADTASRMAIRAWWKRIAGFAVINPFAPSLPGVAYLTDGLHQWDAGTAYEVSKFGTADAIYVSPMARMEFIRARAFGVRRS